MAKEILYKNDIYTFNNLPARKIIVVSVGNIYEFSDAMGIYLLKNSESALRKEYAEKIIFLDAGVSPESLTSKIKKEAPTQIFILDSANFKGEPLDIKLIPSEKIIGLKFSGHNLPLSMIYKYLKIETGADIHIIGIQAPLKGCDQAGILKSIGIEAFEFNEFLYKIFA